MKKNINLKYLFVLAFVVCFSSSILHAQTPFQGKLVIEISTENEGMTMDYYIKGEKIKMIMKGDGSGLGGIIMDGNKSIILMEEQKMYMEFDNKMIQKLNGMFGQTHNNEENKNIDFSKYKTGKTKTILGYNCEQWIFENDGKKNEAWVTTEIGSFQIFKSPMGKTYTPNWGKSLNKNGYFPLYVKTSDDNGMISIFEVKNINRTTLSDSDFTPPSNYKKMNIPGM